MTDRVILSDEEYQRGIEERERAELAELYKHHAKTFRQSVPEPFREASFDSWVRSSADGKIDPALDAAADRVKDWAHAVASRSTRNGLFLMGGVGCGKSTLSVAAGAWLTEAGWRVRYVGIAAYLRRLQKSFDSNIKVPDPSELVRLADVVILDDIGAETPTDWTRKIIGGLIDECHLQGRIILASSNLNFGELSRPDQLGERATSRLLEKVDKLELLGLPDFRKRKHVERRG